MNDETIAFGHVGMALPHRLFSDRSSLKNRVLHSIVHTNVHTYHSHYLFFDDTVTAQIREVSSQSQSSGFNWSTSGLFWVYLNYYSLCPSLLAKFKYSICSGISVFKLDILHLAVMGVVRQINWGVQWCERQIEHFSLEEERNEVYCFVLFIVFYAHCPSISSNGDLSFATTKSYYFVSPFTQTTLVLS